MEYIYVYLEDKSGVYRIEYKFDYATHDYTIFSADGDHEFLKVYENKEDGSRLTKLLVPVEKLICVRCE